MITIISGTNRPGSNTRKVTAHVEGVYKSLNVPFQVLDLAHLPPEIFSPGSYAEKPPAFKKFTDAILAADGVVIVTPEYNGGIPGILKYFIDMLPFPESFENRPVCFAGVSAGIWGALRPIEQLQAIFAYRNAFVYPERVFMPSIHKLLNEHGHLANAEIEKRLHTQAEGFVAFVEKLRGKKLR
jgi:chromate reductase